MSGPRRVQRRRHRGWRLPEGATYVGRPTVWGNPFRISRTSDAPGAPGSWFVVGEDDVVHHPDDDTQRSARQKAVDLYRRLVLERPDSHVTAARIRAELAGRDLVCWCPGDQPCHADVLLEIANRPADTARPTSADGPRPARDLDYDDAAGRP